ncbi:hypothetical protein Metfor_0843 [Methanoregula formicica SMSP]|uniref:Uncharacterized protein n=1 Tax=Methanoregula formicica (strain DSM 22288 / NBRC 105244 / SMSP) TaxID=593750 RepID=L0HCZ5_METFS|nr:hypothetical protein Metfor_0843 [Methanoregula formicica SMSP]
MPVLSGHPGIWETLLGDCNRGPEAVSDTVIIAAISGPFMALILP